MAVTKRAIKATTSVVNVPGTKVKIAHKDCAPHPFVPKANPDYIFRQSIVDEVVWAIESNQNTMLVGDAGTGKSSLVEQLAAIANQPLRRINLNGESDTTLFVGRDVPTEVDGHRTLKFVPGILATAMVEGYWLLLDEIDAALQPMLFVLQGVLEDDGVLVLDDSTGTVVRKHPDFRIFATANTIGVAGRNKLMYSGTMGRMNEATLDRFGAVVHVPPMKLKDEVAVLKSHVPDMEDLILEGICSIAREVRKQLSEEALTCTFSTRRCIQWAKAMTKFHPLRAARMTILNKLSQDDAQVVEGVIQRHFGNG